MTFSKKLKELRKKKRLSQDEFVSLISERTGKSFGRSTISNYENEVSAPSLDVVPHIAKILGVTIDELLGEGPTSGQDSQVIITETGTYPEYPKQGSDKVYEDAVNYGYAQDQLIITIREQLETMNQALSSGNDNEVQDQLRQAIHILTDLTAKYHDQTHKLVDSYQRSNRLAEMLKAPYKL